jgi:CBS domain-containing protein
MKAKDIMTADLRTCDPQTSAAVAAKLMWDGDCGFLPVIESGRLLGVVTDRDLYIALAIRNRLASELLVGDVATRTVVTCEPEADIHDALEAMKAHQIRRLPVVGPAGTLLGLISMDDLVRAAGPRRVITNEQVIETLKAIYADHHAAHVVAV